MKLLSLNCNKFGGEQSNGMGVSFQKGALTAIAASLKRFLSESTDRLVILHEVNYRKEYFSLFQAEFNNDYRIHLPTFINDINDDGRRIRPYGCTLAITNTKSKWIQQPSLELNARQHDYANKSIILKHGELTVLGVHMPYDIAFWESLESCYGTYREHALLIVGDLNVYDKGTDRKQKLEQLLKLGIIDVWTESGNDPCTATCSTGRRIDYALMTNKAYTQFQGIQLDDSYLNNKLSDHTALIVDMKA